MARVIPFSSPAPAKMGSTLLDRLALRVRRLLGKTLNRAGAPGAVEEIDIEDPVTGNRVTIGVSGLYTRISLNGRDYFFRRISGRYDGTGQGCA